jgi:hypothetical protein
MVGIDSLDVDESYDNVKLHTTDSKSFEHRSRVNYPFRWNGDDCSAQKTTAQTLSAGVHKHRQTEARADS